MKVINFILAGLLLLCFPFGFSYVSFSNISAAKKSSEALSLKRVDFANLDESISHNSVSFGSNEMISVINNEPIRPGGNGNQKQEPKKTEGKPKKRIKVLVTGYYTPERNQPKYLHGSFSQEVYINGKGKKTSSGTVPQEWRTVAAHPKLLLPGTEISIEGFEGVFRVEDKGKYIVGKRIDMYMGKGFGALKEAMKLPKKPLTIEVL